MMADWGALRENIMPARPLNYVRDPVTGLSPIATRVEALANLSFSSALLHSPEGELDYETTRL